MYMEVKTYVPECQAINVYEGVKACFHECLTSTADAGERLASHCLTVGSKLPVVIG
jgi:hypothetical protein